jgi:hypothetical protein
MNPFHLSLHPLDDWTTGLTRGGKKDRLVSSLVEIDLIELSEGG